MPLTSFAEIINSYLPEPQASLLNGILLGVPVKTSRDFYEQLKAVGLLHVVVLSGMNITCMANLILSCTRNFGKQLSILITVLILLFFLLLVQKEAPILRASFTGILTLVGITIGRKTNALYLLFLSGGFVALFPSVGIQTVSFQLSYGATLGVILFGTNRDYSRSESPHLSEKLLSYLKDELKVSFAAQLFTIPIILYYFRQISIISPLSNMAIAFVIAPLMVLGFITTVLGKIHVCLGIIPAYICYGLLTYIIFVVEFLSKIPFCLLNF